MLPLVARGIASLAVRLIARNPRLGKNLFSLLKRPSGITLYRGEPVVSKHALSLKEMAKSMYRPESTRYTILGDLGSPALRRSAAGRWFSSKPSDATSYAGRKIYSWKPKDWANIINWGGGYGKGVVKKLTLTPKELKLAKRLQKKVSGHDMRQFYIAPKSTLPRVEKDAILTAIANLKNMMGLKEGGLAQILNIYE